MDKEYTQKELESLSLLEIKEISKSLGLKTNTFKKKLIENILKYKSKPKKIIKRGLYLYGKGKYQEYYDLFLKEYQENNTDFARYFNLIYYIYTNYFKNNEHIEESIEKYPLLGNIRGYYKDDLNDKDLKNDEDYEELMDDAITSILEDIKLKGDKQKEISKELNSYPDPKYHDISVRNDVAFEFGNDLTFNEFVDKLRKNGYKDSINPGDIFGIRHSDISPKDLPLVIIYIDKDNYINKVYMDETDEYIFKEKGFYQLPSKLAGVNREELESIYHFPFLKGMSKLI